MHSRLGRTVHAPLTVRAGGVLQADKSAREPFERANIEIVSADLTDRETVEVLPDAGVVFFLAGKKFGTADSADELRRFNEAMPALVAERFAKSKIVALSTGCVYPFVAPESGGATEETAPSPVGDYALSCLGRERAFLAASESHGTPLALIRLNYSVHSYNKQRTGVKSGVTSNHPTEWTHTLRLTDLFKTWIPLGF